MFNILPIANYSAYTNASQRLISPVYTGKIYPTPDKKISKQML